MKRHDKAPNGHFAEGLILYGNLETGGLASKGFILQFTEALWAEVHDQGVTPMALCPGTTRTELFEIAGVPGWLKKRRLHSPEKVVRGALRALERRKQYYIPGWRNYLVTMLVRTAPHLPAFLLAS